MIHMSNLMKEKKNISTRMDILIVNHHRLAYNMGVKKKRGKNCIKENPYFTIDK